MTQEIEGLYFYFYSEDHYLTGQVIKELGDSTYLVQYDMNYAVGLREEFWPLELAEIHGMIFQGDSHWSFFVSKEKRQGYMDWLDTPMAPLIKVVSIKDKKK